MSPELHISAPERPVGALLAGVNLSGRRLVGTDLRGADLTGTNLAGADLTHAAARVTNADLRDVDDEDTLWPDGPHPSHLRTASPVAHRHL